MSHPQVSGDEVPREERPIRLGSLLFTMVEPHKGHEVAYNRWYERDHFYAGCMVGAATFAGGRFVATRACKELRYPADSPVTPDPMTGSYLAIYWILDGRHDDWNRWGVDQVNWLHANGRMFGERDHVHTLLYDYAGEHQARPGGVWSELALDRHFPGLAVTIAETAEDVEAGNVVEHYRSRPCPAEVMVAATPLPLLADRPGDVPEDTATNRVLMMWFLDEDPVAVWDERFAGMGAELKRAGLGRIVFASPFLSTVPGTDRYADELW
jgi:hypothetical protein